MSGDIYWDRFLLKVNKTETCWLWIAGKNSRGYGKFWDGSRHWNAHRFSYVHFNGPIINDLYVCHHCDIKICVNPDHLFPGTPSDNMRDWTEKGKNFLIDNPRRGDDHWLRKPTRIAAHYKAKYAKDMRDKHKKGIILIRGEHGRISGHRPK